MATCTGKNLGRGRKEVGVISVLGTPGAGPCTAMQVMGGHVPVGVARGREDVWAGGSHLCRGAETRVSGIRRWFVSVCYKEEVGRRIKGHSTAAQVTLEPAYCREVSVLVVQVETDEFQRLGEARIR